MQGIIHVSAEIENTPRSKQLRGLFDVPDDYDLGKTWRYELPVEGRQWSVGLIVGPSGCGKTTIARRLWQVSERHDWPHHQSLVDGFRKDLTIQEITAALSSVGLSSPPSWLKPFHVLSNGEQFRATMARAMTEANGVVCVDEFTSVVDRRVAQIASAAIASYVRRAERQFVAVSCHYDIIDWLAPDWMYEPEINRFQWRSLRRPQLKIKVDRVHSSAWRLFAGHHYLSGDISRSAICFVASVNDAPAAFTAVIHFPHAQRPGWREHRTVCLPDYQGVGIGSALANFVASIFAATGKPYRSTTSHPAFIASRRRSKLWRMTIKPQLRSAGCASSNRSIVAAAAVNRTPASFEYVGPPNHRDAAEFGIINWQGKHNGNG